MGSFVITGIYVFENDFAIYGYEERGSTTGNRVYGNTESVLYETRNLSQNFTEAAANLLQTYFCFHEYQRAEGTLSYLQRSKHAEERPEISQYNPHSQKETDQYIV